MKTRKLLLLLSMCLAVLSCQKKQYASFQSSATEQYFSDKKTNLPQIEAIHQAKPIDVSPRFVASSKITEGLHSEIRNENLARLNSRKEDLKSKFSTLKASYRQIKIDTLIKDKSLNSDSAKVNERRGRISRNLSLAGVGIFIVSSLLSVVPVLGQVLAIISLILCLSGLIVGLKSKKEPDGKRSKLARTGITIGLIPLILLALSLLFWVFIILVINSAY